MTFPIRYSVVTVILLCLCIVNPTLGWKSSHKDPKAGMDHGHGHGWVDLHDKSHHQHSSQLGEKYAMSHGMMMEPEHGGLLSEVKKLFSPGGGKMGMSGSHIAGDEIFSVNLNLANLKKKGSRGGSGGGWGQMQMMPMQGGWGQPMMMEKQMGWGQPMMMEKQMGWGQPMMMQKPMGWGEPMKGEMMMKPMGWGPPPQMKKGKKGKKGGQMMMGWGPMMMKQKKKEDPGKKKTAYVQ